MNSKPANVSVKVTNESAKTVVNTAGKTLKNSLATAQSVKEALLTVSTQLKDAANTLNVNKNAVANSAADAVKANLPAAVEVAKQVGGSSATVALIGGMPKSVIAGGARRAVEESVRQLKKLSVAARDGADAINGGMRLVANGASFVAKNAKRVDMKRVNKALEGAGRVANNNVPSTLANVKVSSSLDSSVNQAVVSNAVEVAKMAGGFAVHKHGGASRKSSRKSSRMNVMRKNAKKMVNMRKSRKSGGASRKSVKSRKNASRKNASRKNASRKDGGFFNMF